MDKIYKYTSIDSAIKIIKFEKVLLNKPTKFNDPFDCSFGLDKDDEKKSFDLLFNYCAIKMFYELVNNKDIRLTKGQQKLFAIINGEFNHMKKLRNKNPYYTEIPMINGFIKQVIKANPQVKVDLDKYYEDFKNEIMKKIDEIKDKALISCFSKRNDSTLMWSHYADSHRGICIEYNFPAKDNYKKVKYTNKRPQMKLFNLISAFLGHTIVGKELKADEYKYTKEILKPFFVKSIDWKYEDEVRCIYTTDDYKKDDIEYDGDNHFVKVGSIKKIFIGCKARGPKVDEILRLASHRKIPVVFMKESEDEFMIVPDKNHKHIPSQIEHEETNGLLRLFDEINKSLDSKAYLSAFILALNIPSICGAKEYSSEGKKEQYIKWANDWFSQYEKPPGDNGGVPYQAAELLWDLKEKYELNGTFNIDKNYPEFYINHLILRYEEKKPFNIYVGEASSGGTFDERECGSLTINVRDFCWKMITLGQKFFDDNQELFSISDIVVLDDYDKMIDEYHEFQILNSKNN